MLRNSRKNNCQAGRCNFRSVPRFQRPGLSKSLRWQAAKILGPFGDRLVPQQHLREYRRIMAHFKQYSAHSRTDRLSNEEIEMWSSRRNSEGHIADRRELFKKTPINQTIYGFAADLIDMAIANDPSIRSVMEVGVYWGYLLGQFAIKYPDIDFIGVDLARDIPQWNDEFARPNLKFLAEDRSI